MCIRDSQKAHLGSKQQEMKLYQVVDGWEIDKNGVVVPATSSFGSTARAALRALAQNQDLMQIK